MPSQDVDQAKQSVRNRVWTRMERAEVVAPPGIAYGKIPNFLGADHAAQRLADVVAPHLELLRRAALLPPPYMPGWKKVK